MSLWSKLFSGPQTKETLPASTLPNTVYTPVSGKVIPLKEINDGVFSEAILGPGCGIVPEGERVCAPFDGVISQTTETKHAIGVTSQDGIEVLIHIGMDTVNMQGKGFFLNVTEGQKVRFGQELFSFDSSAIKAAGYSVVSAIVVTNADQFEKVEVLAEGACAQGVPLFQIQKKEA